MRVQKSMLLALAGSSDVVSAALLGLSAAPRIIRMSADDDTVQIDVVKAVQANAPIEFQVQTDTPATSQVFRLPGTEKPIYLTIETTDLTELGAQAIVQALHPVYSEDGYVNGTTHREVLAPTPTVSNERIVLRDADGKKISEIRLPETEEDPRYTAALIEIDGRVPTLLIAAENDAKFSYIAVPELIARSSQPEIVLDAAQTIELPGNILRNTRADDEGNVAYKLADNSTAKIKLDEFGKPKVYAVQSGMQEGDDTADSLPWQGFGLTQAIQDESGAPTRGYAQPATDSVSFRFVPQAIKAQKAPAQA